jgi:hypothetical protein
VSSYAVGVIKGNQLVLVPLDFALQLRPTMAYLQPSRSLQVVPVCEGAWTLEVDCFECLEGLPLMLLLPPPNWQVALSPILLLYCAVPCCAVLCCAVQPLSPQARAPRLMLQRRVGMRMQQVGR